MEPPMPKLLIAFYFLYYNHNIVSASGHHNIIPVEGYDSELQDLGEHVEIPETPVKVVKITKTIAVKIPVPYPVKVKEKVPYPVHVSKPYPVPVPHIVHVPHPQPLPHPHHHHQPADGDGGHVQNGGYHQDSAPHLFTNQEDGPYASKHSQAFDGNSDGADLYSIANYENSEPHT